MLLGSYGTLSSRELQTCIYLLLKKTTKMHNCGLWYDVEYECRRSYVGGAHVRSE